METDTWNGFTIPSDTSDKVRSLLSILHITGVVHIRIDYDNIDNSKKIFENIRRIANMNGNIEFFEKGVEGIAISTKKVPLITA